MSLKDVLQINRVRLLVLLMLLAALYHAIIPAMVMAWYNDDNYSHGFFIPLVAGYALMQRAPELKRAVVAPASEGLAVVLLGLLILVTGSLGAEDFTMRASLIIIAAGLVLYLFGRSVFRLSLFSLGYLFFMIPLPYIIYDAVAFPLKLFVAKYSVMFLRAIGIIVWREGNIILFPDIVLEVADACSGIRSLISLLAVGTAFAYFTQRTLLKRLIVIVSAFPIALFTNSIRVIATGILARYLGARAAEGFLHEFAGMVIFALAVLLLMLTGFAVRSIRK